MALYRINLQFEDTGEPDTTALVDVPFEKWQLFNDHPNGRAVVTKCYRIHDRPAPPRTVILTKDERR